MDDDLSKTEIARRAGLSTERVRQLLARGETPAAIIEGTYKRAEGAGSGLADPESVEARCREIGLSPSTYRRRRKDGLTHEEAFVVGRVKRPGSVLGRPKKVAT